MLLSVRQQLRMLTSVSFPSAASHNSEHIEKEQSQNQSKVIKMFLPLVEQAVV